MNDKDKTIKPADLPENETFKENTVNQYPQPADWGKPLRAEKKFDPALKGKQAKRTSSEEGLNEEKSAGQAGAFEGFEDHADE